MAMACQDFLLQINRLRSVGERIETQADKHPGMEDGLVSVAGNIRSIATVLDVSHLSEARPAARKKRHLTYKRVST
jgi:hypothetical protein